MSRILTDNGFHNALVNFYRSQQNFTDGVEFLGSIIETCRTIFTVYKELPYILCGSFPGKLYTVESEIGKGSILETNVNFQVYTLINIDPDEFEKTWTDNSLKYLSITKTGSELKYLGTISVGDVFYTTSTQNIGLLYNLYNLGALKVCPAHYRPTFYEYNYITQYIEKSETLFPKKHRLVAKGA